MNEQTMKETHRESHGLTLVAPLDMADAVDDGGNVMSAMQQSSKKK